MEHRFPINYGVCFLESIKRERASFRSQQRVPTKATECLCRIRHQGNASAVSSRDPRQMVSVAAQELSPCEKTAELRQLNKLAQEYL